MQESIISRMINPPIAERHPKKLKKHSDVRYDDYYWLNDRENPEVIAYLEQENEYYKQMTSHTADFQEQLFLEMKSRIKENDSSVPYFYNGYFYLTRYEAGKDYPVYLRRKMQIDAPDEILFDCNIMAQGHPFFQLGGFSISPDNRLAAFSTDVVGRRIYTMQIKDLATGELLPDLISNTTGSQVWANDNRTLFYTTQDEVTLRPDKVWRHRTGSGEPLDSLIYHEVDDTFHVDIFKTKSREYLVIEAESTMTSESLILHADHPGDDFRIFQKRRRGVEYSIAHFDGHFYIRTNKDGATNFKLMKTPQSKTASRYWKDLLPHRDEVLLEDIEIFREYLVAEERSAGLNRIRIMSWDGQHDYYLPFELETYLATGTTNIDFDTELFRYSYQSLATPPSVIDFNMRTGEKTVLKEQEVLGGKFNKEDYHEERLWAFAEDATAIPISIVYRKGLFKNGQNPVLLYGYGSYGVTMECHFSSTRLSLLDRGFAYAIAHVRGGEDLGRLWYEDGKLLKKKNTFNDFIACAKFLVSEGFTSSGHLYAEGGSAGGLLMGAVANMAPSLFNGIIAQVPFVDVVTTMLDDSIPLTTGEYDEWGNPNKKEFYEYMLSYSPYDNVSAQDYPHIYVSTGLHDSQVQYWEPAKWVARLRQVSTGGKSLFLDTNMDAGHGGASGRFEALRELAKEFSFLLDLEGIKK